MNFEELQLVWDSQNREPLYVVNEARLHTLVRKRRDEELRRTAFRHGLEALVNATFGVTMLGSAFCCCGAIPRGLRIHAGFAGRSHPGTRQQFLWRACLGFFARLTCGAFGVVNYVGRNTSRSPFKEIWNEPWLISISRFRSLGALSGGR